MVIPFGRKSGRNASPLSLSLLNWLTPDLIDPVSGRPIRLRAMGRDVI